MSESKHDREKRKLNNWLLDFSYRQTGFFFFIVGLLCIVSFIIPVGGALANMPGGVQSCACGCAAAGQTLPSRWSQVAAALTGLVNALAIVSVAIGIYSVAEAKAASDESAEACRRIERIDDDMEDMLPQLGEMQKHLGGAARRIGHIHRSMQAMLLQMDDLQSGVSDARSKLKDVSYKIQTGYGKASREASDYDGNTVDKNDE